jgi:tripartite-type tricarboxylate transporter receptor subunit TctC
VKASVTLVKLAVFAGVAVMLAGAPQVTSAQDYPSRVIRVIVPYTPGSPNDALARLLVQHLQPRLGQPVIIDNKPGGGTSIGSKAAASSPPDGYTLLFSSSALVIEPAMNKQVEYDPQKDFAPIAFIATAANLMTVNAEVPANSVQAFIDHAAANPGKLILGFAQGTVSQLVGEYFNRMHGLDIVSVPYRGGALVVPDMLGGRVHIYWPTPSTGLPLIRDGKIKALAVTSVKRHADLPQVPSMRELGKDELSLEFWAGLWAPAGTPAAIIAMLNAATNEALQSPEMTASLQKLGFETRVGSPQEFARFIAAEIPHWLTVVKKSDVKSP